MERKPTENTAQRKNSSEEELIIGRNAVREALKAGRPANTLLVKKGERTGALLPIIRRAFENGTIVTVCSQCPQGTVLLGAYETSSELKRSGAVSGHDLTTEAAVAKLYYLFSRGLDKETVKAEMERDLRGELR